MDILTDKKFVIGSLLSVALVFTIFLLAGYINLPFYQNQEAGGPGSCLILEQQYCDQARFYTIDANGTKAAAFNVPEETQIYMPFDGAYFDESPEGENVRIRLGIPDTSVFVIIVSDHTPQPDLQYGQDVTKGRLLAMTINNEETSDTDFNLIIYTENYDLNTLFSN